MKLQNAKGVRDFLPEEMIPRQRILDELREIFERYGYNPLETPAIERTNILTAKFAGGEEILKEIFKVTDQGNRKLGLRYDLTVPMSKVVGMNPDLNLPFKRYQIQEVYRDGPIKLGRYRSFLQCDIDVVGPKSMAAEAEILSITSEFFSEYFDFIIKVNNRKLLNKIIERAGIKKNKMDAILAIDKLEKIGITGVKKELKEKKFSKKQIESLLELLNTKGKSLEILKKLEKKIGEDDGIQELKDLFKYCKTMKVKNVELDISLARGLEYYTGPIFEVFLKKSKITSSLAGGGRYDKMISGFLGRGDYPATGISFGIEPIFEALKLEGKLLEEKTVTKIFIIPIKTLEESLKITKKLRDSGIKTEVDLMERSISKNLSYANSMKIPYVLFVGERELKQDKVKLRDMKTGKESLVNLKAVIKKLS